MPSGQVWVRRRDGDQSLRVQLFDPQGELDDAVLAQLDDVFHCRRTKEVRAVDPRLYAVMSHLYDHFDGRRIDLVSGFRFQRDEGSRHFHASAMDIRIEGVSIQEIYDFVETLDAGNMGIGIYPVSDFVHIDFRAPGARSYRWRDTSPPGSDAAGKSPSSKWSRRRATTASR